MYMHIDNRRINYLYYCYHNKHNIIFIIFICYYILTAKRFVSEGGADTVLDRLVCEPIDTKLLGTGTFSARPLVSSSN